MQESCLVTGFGLVVLLCVYSLLTGITMSTDLSMPSNP